MMMAAVGYTTVAVSAWDRLTAWRRKRMDDDREPGDRLPLPLKLVLLPLWWFVHLFMLLAVVSGVWFVVVGLSSFFADPGDLTLLGEPVETNMQKVLFTIVGALQALWGIGFCVLSWRRYVWAPLLLFAVVVGILMVLGAVTGLRTILG
jgi:hypothetical protein